MGCLLLAYAVIQLPATGKNSPHNLTSRFLNDKILHISLMQAELHEGRLTH
jgi:hypothetical protein